MSPTPTPLDRATLITALGGLYQEWCEAADGKPLETVPTCVGLLLDDVLNVLGLTDLEKGQVKGWWQQGYPRHGKTP